MQLDGKFSFGHTSRKRSRPLHMRVTRIATKKINNLWSTSRMKLWTDGAEHKVFIWYQAVYRSYLKPWEKCRSAPVPADLAIFPCRSTNYCTLVINEKQRSVPLNGFLRNHVLIVKIPGSHSILQSLVIPMLVYFCAVFTSISVLKSIQNVTEWYFSHNHPAIINKKYSWLLRTWSEAR